MKYYKSLILAVILSTVGVALAVPVDTVQLGNSPITAQRTSENHDLKFLGMGYSRGFSYAFDPYIKQQGKQSVVKYHYHGGSVAGELNFDIDSSRKNVAWCVDVYQNVSTKQQSYNEVTVLNQNYLNTVDKLYYQYTQYAATLGGSTSALNIAAAAFQFTLWEVTYETGKYDMESGWFTAEANGVTPLAQEWLDMLDELGDVPSYEKEFLVNGDYQDIMLIGGSGPTPSVPEPVTMLCIGLGCVGVGGYVRKRLKEE